MNAWPAQTKLLIFLTNSLGELDFLTPILNREKKNLSSITLIFTDPKIHQKFLSSDFYIKFFHDLSADVISSRSLDLIFTSICKSDLIQMEQTGGGKFGKIILMLAHLMRKKILIHPHATNVEVGALTKRRSFLVTDHPIMLSTPALIGIYEEQGFHRFRPVGFPKYYPEWLSRFGEKEVSESILIFSRPIDPTWMPESLYLRLMTTAIESSRKILGNLPVIVKVHPREDKKFLEGLISKVDWKNITVSEENSLVLSRRALVAIGFFTSAVFDSYAFGVPSLDYYLEPGPMRNVYPRGRSNRLLGLDTADSTSELEDFLYRVKARTYNLPEYIRELRELSR